MTHTNKQRLCNSLIKRRLFEVIRGPRTIMEEYFSHLAHVGKMVPKPISMRSLDLVYAASRVAAGRAAN